MAGTILWLWHGFTHISHAYRIADFPTGQSGEGIFSAVAASSQMTLAWLELT